MKPSDHLHHPSAEERFGRHVAARLSESAAALPHDITERLRVARLQALAQYPRLQTATTVVSGGTAALTLGGPSGGSRLWRFVASLLPLMVLAAGLVALNLLIGDERARELADIDAAILTDDLPPSAYADPGFAQFLKSASRDQPQ